ncbi:hypothetical protein KHS38_12350 [Mucilaginibacter sp. Bleaf8]|uniref:hypothetical protein n=1 Tax=Mucilaginibacter sp. Bleaf8 TaxID=2834430 RepID=UPI001BCD67C6|nr:hypothetical protein [Mucilaginibacter sp. Bleaf8]MBS7565195.1 hypothetical protein [Mucilaginibacter sp. Bleaf8]
MKRLIIITMLLLAATAVITVTYFKNLSLPGLRGSQVINTIPSTAALIFEFNNDDSFYDIYDSSALFSSITGRSKQQELAVLHNTVLNNVVIKPALNGQNLYISLHPQSDHSTELLYTIATNTGGLKVQDLLAIRDTGFSIKQEQLANKPGFAIHFNVINKDFYISQLINNVYAGSFSRNLVEQCIQYKAPSVSNFKVLSDQQASNTLGTLYINTQQLTPLFSQLFRQANTDILQPLRITTATSTLSLNYKTDALMFNGYTSINAHKASYLSLFSHFKPVDTHLKDVFPITTAYSCSFAVNDIGRFVKLLDKWQQKAGLKKEKNALLSKIKAETGIALQNELNKLLSNEFAIVTTRFDEKLAIIQVKNGSALRPFMNNISTMLDEETGQLNYNRIPYLLLGDAFTEFRRPYFIILDNYLVLANTPRELNNYKENYLNSSFLNKTENFAAFENLQAKQCNVAFYVNFKNLSPVLKRNLKADSYKIYQQEPGLKNFYGASYQLSAADNEFYTNFCLQSTKQDSVAVK